MANLAQFQAPTLVLFFDCPRDLAEGRVVNRMQGREGDNLETFKKRYDEFQELNPPLLERYEKQGKLITVSHQPVIPCAMPQASA